MSKIEAKFRTRLPPVKISGVIGEMFVILWRHLGPNHWYIFDRAVILGDRFVNILAPRPTPVHASTRIERDRTNIDPAMHGFDKENVTARRHKVLIVRAAWRSTFRRPAMGVPGAGNWYVDDERVPLGGRFVHIGVVHIGP